MNRRPDAAERRTRFAWTVVPLSLILFCIVPVFLWSRTNHPNGVEASSEDSRDRKSTRLNSSHGYISYAVFCLKKKKNSSTSNNNRETCRHTSSFTTVAHDRT